MHAACERRCHRKGNNQKGGLAAEDAPVDQTRSGAIEQRDSPASIKSNVHQRYDEITQAHQASKETNRVGACSAQRWNAHLENTEDKTMHVRHNVRRGGRGHEVMSSFSVDCGESTLFETASQLSRGLRLLGSKRKCGPETLTTGAVKPFLAIRTRNPYR